MVTRPADPGVREIPKYPLSTWLTVLARLVACTAAATAVWAAIAVHQLQADIAVFRENLETTIGRIETQTVGADADLRSLGSELTTAKTDLSKVRLQVAELKAALSLR